MTFVIFWFTNIYNRLLLEVSGPLVSHRFFSHLLISVLQKVILRNGSEMLDFWTNPPIDPILKIYVFNYTNIADVIRGDEKVIKLQEVGPYVYRERIVKTGLTFEGHKITYFVRRCLPSTFRLSSILFCLICFRKTDHTLSCLTYPAA